MYAFVQQDNPHPLARKIALIAQETCPLSGFMGGDISQLVAE